MPPPDVTIVVVPRERFSGARRSLESIYRDTEPPFDLVYVDGASPRPVRRWLEESARERGFRLIRSERWLWPNQARNLGTRGVATKYVAFIDNDVVVAPGWLERLVECAEETGAWIVGPTVCEGDPREQRVHVAGGEARIVDGSPAGRRFVERHVHMGRRLVELRGQLARRPADFVEFHSMLVRIEALRRIGPLDERLLTTREHHDVCLLARAAGGGVWHEPASVVTYVTPPPFARSDIRYFFWRWSDDATTRTLERFHGKWELAPDDPSFGEHRAWVASHRVGMALRQLWVTLGMRHGRKARLARSASRAFERFVKAWVARRHRAERGRG